jgi:cell division protein ZipA
VTLAGAGMSMTAELRWALLVIGVLGICALIVWELRRPRQARGAPERLSREAPAEPPRHARESFSLPEVRAREPLLRDELPVVAVQEPATLPVLEPATEVEALAEEPVDPMVDVDVPDAEEAAAPIVAAAAEYFEPATEVIHTESLPLRDELPELAPAETPEVEWPPDQERRILALRLVAPQANRFAGRSLRQALAAEGFVLGKFAIFHKPDDAHRAVLSAASLNRPGTFDMDTMDSQHFGGLSLFAVLPGPMAPPQAFDELVFTARSLNERLQGVLQDEEGSPLTPARVALLREQLRPAS